MKIYKVLFNGSYLGGKAIIKAETKDEARRILHEEENEPLNEIGEVFEIPDTNKIIYYDNGDY